MCFPHTLDDEVILTYLTPRDGDRFYALVDRNREHLGRWFSWVKRYQSTSDARAFAEANLQRMATLSGMTCLVWHRKIPAGLVDLLNLDVGTSEAEVGFWLGEDFQGLGIARKATAALMEYAFVGLGFQLIRAKVRPGNDRSRRLLEGMGFSLVRQGESLEYEVARDSRMVGLDRRS
jgi:ribosomal-protein-serine acetyltransferase